MSSAERVGAGGSLSRLTQFKVSEAGSSKGGNQIRSVILTQNSRILRTPRKSLAYIKRVRFLCISFRWNRKRNRRNNLEKSGHFTLAPLTTASFQPDLSSSQTCQTRFPKEGSWKQNKESSPKQCTGLGFVFPGEFHPQPRERVILLYRAPTKSPLRHITHLVSLSPAWSGMSLIIPSEVCVFLK